MANNEKTTIDVLLCDNHTAHKKLIFKNIPGVALEPKIMANSKILACGKGPTGQPWVRMYRKDAEEAGLIKKDGINYE